MNGIFSVDDLKSKKKKITKNVFFCLKISDVARTK